MGKIDIWMSSTTRCSRQVRPGHRKASMILCCSDSVGTPSHLRKIIVLAHVGKFLCYEEMDEERLANHPV